MMSKARAAILCTPLGAGLVILAVAGVTDRAAADAPSGRYEITSGEVLDTQTRLVWQQVSSSTKMSWADAQTYCEGEWRLPSVNELQTLVDDSQTDPAVDTTAFADVSADAGYEYWCSSPVVGLSSVWWFVELQGGHNGYGNSSTLARVRCVRGEL